MIGKLTSVSELLFRQIHPSFREADGTPSSQPFCPTPKDDHKLSVDRSSLTNAQASYELYTGDGFASIAVYGLTVGEFSGEIVDCISDPRPATEKLSENPAHAYADYSPHTTSRQKNIAKKLKRAAILRGCLYSPPVSSIVAHG